MKREKEKEGERERERERGKRALAARHRKAPRAFSPKHKLRSVERTFVLEYAKQ